MRLSSVSAEKWPDKVVISTAIERARKLQAIKRQDEAEASRVESQWKLRLWMDGQEGLTARLKESLLDEHENSR